jgi:transcriptional regulator with XRE-family HTH domain
VKGKMAGVDSEAERATFARNLRAARMRLGLRQKDICQATGIAQPHLSDIEAGGGNIALDTMVKLATAVNLPLWKLFKPGEIIHEDEILPSPRSMPRERRDNAVDIEFKREEMRRLKAAAAEAGMPVPEFIRATLRNAGIFAAKG